MLDVSEIDQMDCYVGVEADIFVASKRPQLPFRFPSSDYYMQWGEANSEHFQSANEYCVSTTNVAKEELNFNEKGSHNEVEVKTSLHGESSTDSSWCEEFCFFDQIQMNPEASLDMTRPLGNQPDYQFDGMVDPTDGIFLKSLLEETSPRMENPYMLPLTTCSTISSENLLMDMIVESQSVSMNKSTANISENRNSRTLCFPKSADWERLEDTPLFIPSDSGPMEDCSMTKEPGLIRAGLNSPHKVDRHLSVEGSLEESALQELEVAMAQVKLTKSTRLCFRDALYRLAKSSIQRVTSQNRNGEITMEKRSLSTVPNEKSRFGKVSPTDYRSNTVDRTIAKLMFDKLDCDTHDISSPESVSISNETVITDASPNYDLNRIPIPLYHRCLLLPLDADVSVLGGENNMMVDFY